MNRRESLRSDIAETVAAVRVGDSDRAAVLLTRLTDAPGCTMRDCVRELVAANVTMLQAAAGGVRRGEVDFSLDGVDAEGRPVGIDEVEPSQRAATRIMLALAGDRSGDAEIQLNIVAARPGTKEMGLVFVHTLYWTMELLDLCEGIEYAVPDWLRRLAA
jgi:hypothetical protein